MNGLTTFQVQCETKLVEVLRANGVELADRRLDGEHETYIMVEIPTKNIKIYIYTDEPELIFNNKSYIYEVPDYRDVEVRISKFVDAVISILKGNVPRDEGSNRFVLFKGEKL